MSEVGASASADNVAPCCYLLELPAELRNRIYEFALMEDLEIQVSVLTRDARFCHWTLANDVLRLPQEPALLRASQKIRNEALSIYYGNNIFEGSEKKFVSWLQTLDTKRRGMLKELRQHVVVKQDEIQAKKILEDDGVTIGEGGVRFTVSLMQMHPCYSGESFDFE